LNRKNVTKGVVLLLFCCLVLPGLARGQASKGQFVVDLGVAYTQATADDAASGLVGLDIAAGKMLNNSIYLGFGTGADVVSYENIDDYHSRLVVFPLIVKARYYITFNRMLQAHVSLAGGAYRVSPHLASGPIGGVKYSMTQPGGSVGIGIDYYFLLTTGVTFELEYHMFNTDYDDMFGFFAVRVNYSVIKF
jgi:hypothetical protein